MFVLILDRGIPFCNTECTQHKEVLQMSNFLMMLAASGVFYTAISSTLYDMTVTACESQVGNYELACKEVNR